MQSVVKLADFGVAAKLTGASEGDESLTQSVVGTPYWMAPEVIEMTSVTAAADIWSVGCLTIELLTGQPPYFDLQPMSALFRIVQVCNAVRKTMSSYQFSGTDYAEHSVARLIQEELSVSCANGALRLLVKNDLGA